MKKFFKVGVIGVGNIAQTFHIPAWMSNKKIIIESIADINLKNLNKVKKKYKINKAYTNYRDMLKNENIDIISISTPPNQHVKNIIDCVNSDKDIFVEKPFVINKKEFFKIKRLKNLKKKKYIQCALHQRYRPITKSIKNSLNKKEIGDVYYINIVHRRYRSIPKHSNVFSQKKLSGGGPLIDLGWHYFDLVFWILKFPKIKNYTCNTFKQIFRSKLMKKYLIHKKFNNEECAIGNIEVGKNTRVNFELSYVMNSYEEETKIELFGNKGSIVWPNNSYYVLKKNTLIKKKFNYKKELASKLQINDFVKNLNNSKYLNKNLKEYFYIIDLIEKLYNSSKKELL